VQADAVLSVRPCPDVTLYDLDPASVPPLEGLLGFGVGDVLRDLADAVGVVAVDRLLPFLVGIEELVPVR
jgi:hypothetical protein